MTANAEARALLDQLMGVERDALLPAGKQLVVVIVALLASWKDPFGFVAIVECTCIDH